MKRTIVVMAAAIICASSISAQDTFKEVSKMKDLGEAEKAVKAGLGSMSAEEKAKCYNALVDICHEKIKKAEEIMNANQVAETMKNGKIEEYDTVGLYDAALKIMEYAALCDEADNQPNEKGKVKPAFHKKNQERVFPLRYHLINGGVNYQGKDDKLSGKFLAAYVDSWNSPLFADMAKGEDPALGQIAYFAAVSAYQSQNYEAAEAYADVAGQDGDYATQAMQLKLAVMQVQLKSHTDSLAYIDKLKDIYAQDESNDAIFSTLTGMLLSMNMNAEADAIIDKRIADDPNNFAALASRGQSRYDRHEWDKAIEDFEKATAIQPESVPIIGLIGNCYMYKAKDMAESISSGRISPDQESEILGIYSQAITWLEKARDLDYGKEFKPYWAYPLYNCCYIVYGEDDPKTTRAESDTK